LDHLKVLEVALHQYDVRADIDKLTELLHPKYIEIGFSGRTYDFRSIIDSLLSESSSGFEVWSQDYEYIDSHLI
jgi:hypothetical protein